MKTRMFIMTLTSLVVGWLAGTSVALLYAPQSGRVTRAQLRSKGLMLQDKVNEEVVLTKTQIKDTIGNLNYEARSTMNNINGLVKNTVSTIALPLHSHRH